MRSEPAQSRPVYLLALQPARGRDGIRGLRALLKTAWRRDGLRAIEVRELRTDSKRAKRLPKFVSKTDEPPALSRRPDSTIPVRRCCPQPEPAPITESNVLSERDLEGVYGSRMMSGAELGGRKIRAKISDVRKETLQGRNPGEPARTKIVLDLADHDKKLALNATNFNYLRDNLGHDPQKWVGVEIGIRAEDTSFGGHPVKGIRIKVLNSAAPAPAVTLADTYDD
jgi:hypothetical protein